MQLSDNDLNNLCDYAISAATQAGKLIQSYAAKSVEVKQKEGGDTLASQVVTQADLDSEVIILKTLAPTCEQYDLALLTEESCDDKTRLQKDFFWCIDPLDGTLSFIESSPGYAVSIALVANSGTPMIGVVYDPVKDLLYSAIKGLGVKQNGRKWQPELANHNKKNYLTMTCDRSFFKRQDYARLERLIGAMAKEQNLEKVKVSENGGAVINALQALENAPGCYIKLPKPQAGGGSLWDFAATAAIYNEVGAVTCDIHGQALELNRADSTFMNHRGALYATDPDLAVALQAICQKLL